MKELIVAAWDDMYLQTKQKVAAERTVRVGLDGKWLELDLTQENYDHLLEDLQIWLNAGHRPDEGNEHYSSAPAAVKHDPDSVRRKREIREFAKKFGLSYTTSTGKYYYSLPLCRAYEAFLGGVPESEWRPVYDTARSRSRRGNGKG